MLISRKLRWVKVDKQSGVGVEQSKDGKIVDYRGKQLVIKIDVNYKNK